MQRVSPATPLIELDSRYYKRIADFEARFPQGAPSLRSCTSLTVAGDWTFGADVVCEGETELADAAEPRTVPSGTVLRLSLIHI